MTVCYNVAIYLLEQLDLPHTVLTVVHLLPFQPCPELNAKPNRDAVQQMKLINRQGTAKMHVLPHQ